MYKLMIHIKCDNRYLSYQNSILGTEGVPLELYFEQRKTAVLVLKQVISEFSETITCPNDKPYIRRFTIPIMQEYKNKIFLICKKFKSFYMYDNVSSVFFEIKLVKVNKKKIAGGFTYEEHEVDEEFYSTDNIYDNLENISDL